jgi:3-mercaptopyruvate sulfurtransferase SseA
MFLAAAGCLFLAPPLAAEEGVMGNLVSVDWLQKNLNDPDLLLLDASPAQTYTTQHIHGAVNVDMFTYGIQEMPAAEMEHLFQSWGISSGKKVVIYDQGGGMMATRVFFSLYYHGFPATDLLILDGGLSKWLQEGFPVTEAVSRVSEKGTFQITRFNEEARVKLPEFLTASGDPANNALLEALGANWHFGEVAAFDRAGHIPHGILLPSTDFYNADKTFKSVEDIQAMLTYLGVGPEKQVYTYCGGGVAASVPFFALKFILNYPRVKLFIESEMGWLYDERELPYWTYDAPFLMRGSEWLNFWGGRMIRMYGGSQVSIVDVRPAGEFDQGHVPFAINVSAEVLKNNLARPDGLADILGPAGIDASHEAIVISGAGLTKDSALAFVLLEESGQKRVSVFMDSLDKWAQLGFAVTKDATVVGPKKDPRDLSIPPAAYAGESRSGVIIADPRSTEGVYPKVFIAAGKDVPAGARDGEVVHVPYTDLLDADGAPKAAKDIWSILATAGVPRYAELVCFSADPGEAAIAYFILKLMGYPDIKVLMD